MQLIHGDCLEVIQEIPDNSIDMVLADPPYGTTQCKWDSVIELNAMWAELKRVATKKAAIVMTASQPFTSALVSSNYEMFKHEWIWIKNRGSNFANTVREPMKEHESVLMFSRGKWTYNRQMQERTGGGISRAEYEVTHDVYKRDGTREFEGRAKHAIPKLRVPSSWQKFNVEVGLHPTQKPLGLMKYMIKTFTNEGDTVLDFAMGSGTTGVACKNLNRKFIGIELEKKYFDIAQNRILKKETKKETSN